MVSLPWFKKPDSEIDAEKIKQVDELEREVGILRAEQAAYEAKIQEVQKKLNSVIEKAYALGQQKDAYKGLTGRLTTIARSATELIGTYSIMIGNHLTSEGPVLDKVEKYLQQTLGER
jgi:hypothetical protein